MKRLVATSTLVLALAALAVSTALAGSGGKGSQTLSATCTVSGAVTVHASSGQSAWVNSTHWVVYKFTGIFTPAGGTPQMFTKVYGRKLGLVNHHRTTDMCTGSQTDSSGNTFEFTAWVVKTTR